MSLDQVRGDADGSELTLGRRGGLARRHGITIAAPVVYLVGSMWLYFPLLRHLRSAQMGGPDTSLFTWWLGWTPYAILHGHSPFVSTLVNAPHGVNAMWNTSVPLLGLIMTPVTETAGPIATVNVLLILAPALSAWAAFAAARMLRLSQRSAFLVGFLYGFSTYTLAQDSSGHLHLSMAIFPPLVAALLYRIVEGSISARRGGLLLGLAGVLQIWVSEEILATSAVLTVIVFAVLAVMTPRERVEELARRLVRVVLWAAVIAVPLATPALVIQFFGQGHLSSGVTVGGLSSDVFTPITPTRQTLVGLLVPTDVKNRIQGDAAEITAYLGLPLVALLLLSRRRIRSTHLRWCWIPLIAATLLSIGWTLNIAGHDTTVPGPGQVMAQLPVLQSILTPRFSVYMVLFSALMAGAIWDSLAEAEIRVRQLTLAALALVVVAVFPWQSARMTRLVEPTAFASGRPLPGIPDGATVAILPWPTTINDAAMRWQALDNFHFKLVGAYGIVAGPGGRGDYGSPKPDLDKVARHLSGRTDEAPPAGGNEEHLLLDELATLRTQARDLIIGPAGDPAQVARYFSGLLHEQPTFTGGIYIFPLQPS